MILQLPLDLQFDLEVVHGWLNRFTNLDIVLGGGTVLASRWRHRLSTDIDLFHPYDKRTEFFEDETGESWFNFLLEKQRNGKIDKLITYDNGATWESENGSISVVATDLDLRRFGVYEDTEASTGIRCETTAEILYRKIDGRMTSTSRYLARDMYDVVCAATLDPNSLKEVMSYLTSQQKRILAEDYRNHNLVIHDIDRLIDPRAPSIATDEKTLQVLAGEVLTESLSTNANEVLEQAKLELLSNDDVKD